MQILSYKNNLLFILIVASLGTLQAQDWVEFKGRVIDEESGLPLEGALVVFENHDHIGSFTDEEGNFTVRVSKTFENDVLIVSFLGFEKRLVPFTEIKFLESNVFELKKAAFLLDEVVVLDEGRKLREIVLGAVEKIPVNYPVQPHLLEGLYRKISTEGSGYTHLEEAAVSVEDYDYKKPIASLKIQVHAVRQTPDFGQIDSLQLKLNQSVRQSAATKFQVSSNPLFRAYEGNFLRLYKNDGTIFNIKTLSSIIEKNFEFRVLGFETVGRDTILQIAFSEGITLSEPSGSSYFKINLSDQAIVEFQITRGFQGKLNHQTIIKFSKTDGRYYPCFIKVTQPRFINRNLDSDEYDIAIYWFDEVKVAKIKNIQSKNSSDRFQYNYAGANNLYDPKFWVGFKPLSLHPLEAHIKNSLERNGPLEEQFLRK